MTRIHWPAGAVVALAILFSSCAPKRSEVALNTETTPAGTLLDHVAANGKKITSLVGHGTMSFDGPEVSGTAAFESSLKKPDSLLVTLEGPFGLDMGTFFLSRQKYILYNSLENRVVTGVPSTHAIRSVLPFDMTYDQILDAFSGVFSVPNDRADLLQYATDQDNFLLTYTCGEKICRYWVDPRYFLVTRYELRGKDDKVIIEAEASAFDDDDGAVAPHRISVRFPQEHRAISISYSALRLNGPNPSFAFTVPASAETIVR